MIEEKNDFSNLKKVYLPRHIVRELDKWCKQEGETVTNTINRILQEYVIFMNKLDNTKSKKRI